MSLATQMRRAAAGVPAGGGFSPADVGWAELFWAEGDDFTALGYGNGDNVTAWPSETSAINANTMVAGYPTFASSVADLNGQPAVEGVGGEGLTAGAYGPLTQPFSVVAVAVPSLQNLVSKTLVSSGTGAFDNTIMERGPRTYARMGSTLISSAVLAVGTAYLATVYFNGASSVYEYSGTGTTGNPGSNSLSAIYLLNGVAGYRGSVALVGIYDGDVRSDGAWADFESWVSDHYGITIA